MWFLTVLAAVLAAAVKIWYVCWRAFYRREILARLSASEDHSLVAETRLLLRPLDMWTLEQLARRYRTSEMYSLTLRYSGDPQFHHRWWN